MTDTDTGGPEIARVVAKARRRLIPFLFVLYIVAYLDRINVGFAARGAINDAAHSFALGLLAIAAMLAGGATPAAARPRREPVADANVCIVGPGITLIKALP